MSTWIFGLAELPVETIADVVKVNSNSKVPQPVVKGVEKPLLDIGIKKNFQQKNLISDKYTTPKKANAFVKMRNGFGKLMSHFSKVKI